MQIVIEQSEFRELSPQTQREILERLSGRRLAETVRRRKRGDLHWRRPVDLSPILTAKLLHGLAEPHRKRLGLLASQGGRASMQDLLQITGDSDWHVLSYFQSVITRRLRRLIEDPERKAELLKWDFDSTKWNGDRTAIVDGVYYLSEATARSLQQVMKQSA